jgi:5-methylcytosine-specific restriction protein A
VIAVCPNCHRRVHYGEDGDAFNNDLIETAEERNERLR